MKKLSKETIDIIRRLSDVSKVFNIGVFVIDKSGIRAKAEEAYIFLFQNTQFDFWGFHSLCINKVSEFNNRLSFMDKVSGSKGFDIELSQTKELDSGDKIALKLQLITKDTAIEIGCSNAAKYNFPKGINDEDLVTFTISNNSIETINRFSRIVQNKNKLLNIMGIEGIITASTEDTTGDTATHILSSNPNYVDSVEDFKFTYNINNLLPMLRGRMSIDITLSKRGVLMTKLNDIDVIMLPEKLT